MKGTEGSGIEGATTISSGYIIRGITEGGFDGIIVSFDGGECFIEISD